MCTELGTPTNYFPKITLLWPKLWPPSPLAPIRSYITVIFNCFSSICTHTVRVFTTSSLTSQWHYYSSFGAKVLCQVFLVEAYPLINTRQMQPNGDTHWPVNPQKTIPLTGRFPCKAIDWLCEANHCSLILLCHKYHTPWDLLLSSVHCLPFQLPHSPH